MANCLRESIPATVVPRRHRPSRATDRFRFEDARDAAAERIERRSCFRSRNDHDPFGPPRTRAPSAARAKCCKNFR